MNTHSEKIVITPGNWYNGVEVPDLYPNDWIVMDADAQFSFQEKTATHILLKEHKVIYPGLIGGKMGLCIHLFQTARLSKNNKYEVIATDLLENIYENISLCREFDFGKYGILGVAAGIQFLIEENYVQGNANEVLGEIDTLVRNSVFECLSQSLSRLSDLLDYLILRLKYNLSLNEPVQIQQLYDTIRTLLSYFEKQLIQNDAVNERALCLLDKLREIKHLKLHVEEVLFRLMNVDNLTNEYINARMKNLLTSPLR